MVLQPEVHERWLANLAAAGIDMPEEDRKRILERGFGDRVTDFTALIARLDQPDELPDYVHDTVGEEPGDE